MSKVGYMKYLPGRRGPSPEKREEYLAFWTRDLADNDEFMQQAIERGPEAVRVIKRQRRKILEALKAVAQ